jgi:hypothetical protein
MKKVVGVFVLRFRAPLHTGDNIRPSQKFEQHLLQFTFLLGIK